MSVRMVWKMYAALPLASMLDDLLNARSSMTSKTKKENHSETSMGRPSWRSTAARSRVMALVMRESYPRRAVGVSVGLEAGWETDGECLPLVVKLWSQTLRRRACSCLSRAMKRGTRGSRRVYHGPLLTGAWLP